MPSAKPKRRVLAVQCTKLRRRARCRLCSWQAFAHWTSASASRQEWLLGPAMYYASSSSRLLECKTNYMVPSGSRQLQACKTGQPTRHIRLYRIRYCIRGSCGNRYRAHVYARQAACIIPLARARRRHPPPLGRPLAGRPRAAGVTPAQGRGCRSAAAGSPGRTRARPRARPAASATCARPAPRRAPRVGASSRTA